MLDGVIDVAEAVVFGPEEKILEHRLVATANRVT